MRDGEPRLDPIGTKLRRFAIHAFRTLRFAVVDLGHGTVGICRCCPKGGFDGDFVVVLLSGEPFPAPPSEPMKHRLRNG